MAHAFRRLIDRTVTELMGVGRWRDWLLGGGSEREPHPPRGPVK
jgi:hypothetical protein